MKRRLTSLTIYICFMFFLLSGEVRPNEKKSAKQIK